MFTKINAYIDFFIAINIINKNKYSKYSKIYPFTTENISGYINKFNFKNKKVLTVTGSFDHSLNLMLGGCTDITNFDVNKLSIYISRLKISAIKTLTLEEFIEFFDLDYENSLRYFIFNKIKKDLDTQTKTFFELMYKKNIIKSLFIHKYKVNSSLNNYLTPENYKKLKNNINKVDIKFITSNVTNIINKISEKYDYILLSNISDYIKDIYKKKYLEQYSLFIKNKLSKLLTKNGQIICAYIYDYKAYSIKPRTDIDINYERKKYFNRKEFKTIKFKSVINKNKKDAIIIYRRNYGK